MTLLPGARDSILCGPLPAFDHADLHAARAAFHDATAIPLAQTWLDEPEPDFAPATVRTGWRGEALLVFAELSDADIHTRATRHNDRLWELGDTFEMFLQPGTDAPYVELHVTPNNLRLQLRFDQPPDPNTGRDPFGDALMPEGSFESRAWVLPAARKWCVLAEIPLRLVSPGLKDRGSIGTVTQGSTATATTGSGADPWRCSFCRYDYTRGRARAVISSSSAHSQPRFHQPKEWTEIRLTGLEQSRISVPARSC